MSGKGANSICRKALITLLLAIPFAGCGISTTAYLYAPLNFSITPSAISIRNNGLNYEPSEGSDQTFLGIDIYYRIFQNRQDAETALSTVSSLRDGYLGNPDAFINYVEAQEDFCYMRKAATSARPGLEISPASDESPHTIDTSSWKLDGTVQLVRNISRPENSFLEKNFNEDDQDYEGSTSIGGTFSMVLFAVSYGQDTIGAPVYSNPVVASSILEF